MTNYISPSTTKSLFKRPLTGLWVIAFVLALVAGLTPRAYGQTFDKAHASALVLAGNGNDPVNTLTLSATSGAAPISLLFPNAATATTYVLSSDGSGHLTWTSLSGAGVTSVTGTLPITASTVSGAVTVGLNLGNLNTWTGEQSFNGGISSTTGNNLYINDSSTGTQATDIDAYGPGGVINIGNTGSTTNFLGTVSFPAGSVTSSSLGLAKNDIFIGDATSASADTAMMTQDVTLQNTSAHIAQATVNGSHATTFAVANAETVGTGLTVTSGGASIEGATTINTTASSTNTTSIGNSGANVTITGGGIDLYGGVGSQPNGSVNVMTGNFSVQAGNIGVATGTIGVGGHTVIDNSDDLTNIKAITASSTITFSGLPVASTPGIVHANGSGVLSSSLIVNGDITPGTITYASIKNETASTLLGNPTGGAASPSEITLGSGLSFSGTTLTATGSGGTVTSVSVTPANGVSGTVLNPTTTPAISLTLGAITPTSVAATGAISGAGLTSDVSTNNGATGAALTLDNTGGAGGYDVTGTGNTWYVTDAGLASFSGLNNTGTLRTTGGTTNINTTGTNPINIGDTSGAMNINIGNNSGPSVTTLGGAVNFTGTVTLPAGSVTSSSLGLAKNDIFIGDATLGTADTAMMTQDVTLQNTTTHVAQATVNGSHATTFAVTNAETVGTTLGVTGLTTTSGGITNTGALTTSGGTSNINSTLAGSPQNTNIDASPATGGTNDIGNSTSTTNIAGAVTFTGSVTLPAGSVSASSIGLANQNIFVGNSSGDASAVAPTANSVLITDATAPIGTPHWATTLPTGLILGGETINGASTINITGAIATTSTLGVTGLTTATGGISVPSTAGINNSSTINTVVASTTNIDATTGAEGVINIGNNGGTTPLDSSTTNIAGALNISGTTSFTGPVTFTTAPTIPLTTNDLFVGVSGNATPLATANGGVLNTSSSGVPSITATPTLGVAGTTAGTLTLASGAAAFTTQLATSATTPTASYIYQFPAQTPTSPTNGQVLTAGTPTGTGPYTIPLSWATPASVSSGNVNYNVSSAQTGASSSNELFNVSYGSVSGNPTLAGALISSVLSTGNGNATGLTITANAHSSGSATGLEIFTSGGSNDTAIAVRSGNVNIAGLTTNEPVFTDANDNLASVATVPIANGGTNSSTALTNGKVMISSTGAIVEGPAWNSGTSTLTGNITGNAGGSAASFTGSLAGDVKGTQGATVINNTSAAGADIIAALTANAGALTNNTSGSAASFTGSLVGDVTGTQGATKINNTSAAGADVIAALTANAGTLTNNTSGNATTSTTATKIVTTNQTTGTYFPAMVASSVSSTSTSADVAAGLSFTASATVPSLTVGTANSSTGSIVLANVGNTNLTTITVPSGAPAITYTLPSVAPLAGQYLSSTTSGGLSWASPAGGVTSVTATNTSLTISPTTGAVLAGLNLSNANTWLATQTFPTTDAQGSALAASINSATTTKINGGEINGAVALATTATTANGLASSAFANPTQAIGLTAVAGSAVTAMRSDGAPALSVTIIPTWSGLHTFTGGLTTTSTTSINATGTAATTIGASTAGNTVTMVSGTTGSINNMSIGATTASTGTFTTMTTGATVLTSNSPTQLGSGTTTNAWALGSANSYFKVSAGTPSGATVDGILAGTNTDGRVIILVNNGTTNITLNSDVGTAGDEIHMVGGAGNSLILAPDGMLTLIYDSAISEWRVLSSK